MAFDKKLLDIVACPLCKGKLKYVVKIDEDGNKSESLVCRFDRLRFPIIDGIPVLLEEDATHLSLEEVEAL